MAKKIVDNSIRYVISTIGDRGFEVQAGDIVLHKNKSFLARAIRFFMDKYRKRLNLPEMELFNHVSVIVELWGTLWVAEAAEKGIQIVPLSDLYNQYIKVKRFNNPLTQEEKESVSKYAVKYALNPHRYDFFNFIFQAIMIARGKWSGPKGKKAEKRIYCSEFAAMCMKYIRNSFKNTYDKNPLDIDISKDLKDVELFYS